MKHLKLLNEAKVTQVVPEFLKTFLRGGCGGDFEGIADIKIEINTNDVKLVNDDSSNKNNELKKVFHKYEKEIMDAIFLDNLNMMKNPYIEIMVYSDFLISYGIDANNVKYDAFIEKNIKVKKSDRIYFLETLVEQLKKHNFTESNDQRSFTKIPFDKYEEQAYYIAYVKKFNDLKSLTTDLEFLHNIVEHPHLVGSTKLMDVNKKLGIF